MIYYEKNTKKRIVLDIEDYYDVNEDRYTFKYEDGSEYTGDNEDIVTLYDEFDRPVLIEEKLFERTGLTLNQFINLTPAELAEVKKKSLLWWEKQVLNEMDEKNYVHCPFADGSICLDARKFFLKRRKAKPLYKFYSEIEKKKVGSRESIFKYKNKFWVNREYEIISVDLVKI